MSELATLERRRKLVVLAADLQRATVVQRLGRIDTRPSRIALGLALALARTRAARRIAFSAISGLFIARRTRALRRQPG
jgi:hypothetical protein